MIKKILTGLTIPQQYVCLAKETLRSPLQVLVSDREGNPTIDVTNSHLLLGYKPVIIALRFPFDYTGGGRKDIKLSFLPQENDRPVAFLRLRRIEVRTFRNVTLMFFEATHGSHDFLFRYQQLVNNLRDRFRREAPGNISLPGNEHDMVRIAYGVARTISVISLGNDDAMNMFPTDLHGPISENHYVSSLRKNGKATEQVTRISKLILANVEASTYREVYALGKNHMRELRSLKEFPVSHLKSKVLSVPVPKFALNYFELKCTDSFDLGVHRIHFYEILNKERIRDGLTLSHVHQYYAQWRVNNHLETEMLLR